MKPPQIVIRSSVGVYFITPWAGPGQHGFTTLDINKATRFSDTEEIRARFVRNYDFALEFVPVE